MRQNHTAHRVALGLLLAGAAIPAAAQDAQPVTPPIITPAPAPAATPAPAPTASPGITFAPQAPVVQAVPPPPAPPPEAAATEAPAPRATSTRQRTTQVQQRSVRTTTRSAASAPSAAAPAAAAPAAVAPAPAPSPQPQITPAPEAAAPTAPATTPAAPPAQEEISSAAAWAFLAIPVIAILGLIALLVARRRRARAEAFDDTYYTPVEETVVAEPVAAAPVAAVADEAAGRPWIDIGLRPVRAEDGLDVEVTVSNSGDAPAHDVRVSTWMLNGAESSEGERALIEARSGAQIATVDVAPGDNESVDTTVALPSDAGTPILVAEARYPLPMGGEGRIAATFEIDVVEGDVEARLHDVLERA